MRSLNGEDFQQFIDALSRELGEDIALTHMDRAGAHITNELSWSENLIPVCQPSHSPELNPIERVWEYQTATCWRSFYNTGSIARAIETSS